MSLKKLRISVPKKDDNRDNMRQLLSASGQLEICDNLWKKKSLWKKTVLIRVFRA